MGIEPIYAHGGRRDAGRRAAAGGPDAGPAPPRPAAAHRPGLVAACARPGPTRARARWRGMMLPALLGVGVAQISLLINTQIASWLRAGQRHLAQLCRPADGVPDRHAGRRAGRGADAAAGRRPGRQRRRALFGDARLGPAPGGAAGRALRRSRCWCSRSRWSPRCSTTAPSSDSDVQQVALALVGYGAAWSAWWRSRCWRRASTPARTCARRCASPSWCW